MIVYDSLYLIVVDRSRRVVVVESHEKVRIEAGLVIVDGGYEDSVKMERKGDCEGAFLCWMT